ncbi:MAG: hypothetical protein ACREIN_04875 [Candidatus Methylomirabilaceae bacterium]
MAHKVSEQRVAEIRRFLARRRIRREAEEFQHLRAFLSTFPDATLREVYIAGFGLTLHYTFDDDIEYAKAALLMGVRLSRNGDRKEGIE